MDETELDILLSIVTARLIISSLPLHVVFGEFLLTYSDSAAAAAKSTTYMVLPSIAI